MKRRWRFRFSVTTLLTAISLIAIGFGVARWQRQRTLAAYCQLHDDGVGLILVVDKSRWPARLGFGDFWLRVPRTAEVYVSRLSSDQYKIGSATVPWEIAKKELLLIKDRLVRLDVNDIQVWYFDGPAPASSFDVLRFAAENGMAGGIMSSQDEIDQRLKSLESQLP